MSDSRIQEPGQVDTPPRRRSIPRTVFLNMVILTVLGIVVIGSAWTLQEYHRFEEDAETLYQTQLEARKETMRQQVDQVVDYVEYKREQTDVRIRSMVKDHAMAAHKLATSLYDRFHDELEPDTLQEIILETIRTIRYNEGRGYIFAISLEGVALANSNDPEYEGTNLYNLQDPSGVYVVRELIDLVRREGEGFYTYQWTQPGVPGNDHQKVSYVKYFPPFDCYIGTGEYLSVVEELLKEETIARIEEIRYGEDAYVFAGQWDGFSLTAPGKGQNVIDITDSGGVQIVRELIEQAKSSGGFVSYVMPKFEGQRPEPKISYARGIPEWEWYVGTGVYIDDIEKTAATYRATRLGQLQWNVAEIVSLLLVLCLGAFVFARRVAGLTQSAFDRFLTFFDQVSRGESALPVEGGGFREFDELASAANRMVKQREEAESRLREREEHLQVLFSNAADAMYVSDLSGKLVRVNQQACKATGYTESELLSMNITDVDAEIHDRDNLDPFLGSLSPHKVTILHSRHRKKDESTYPVEIRISLMDTPDGARVLGIARDVTKRIKAEKETAGPGIPASSRAEDGGHRAVDGWRRP